jgi:hypothetical protein
MKLIAILTTFAGSLTESLVAVFELDRLSTVTTRDSVAFVDYTFVVHKVFTDKPGSLDSVRKN